MAPPNVFISYTHDSPAHEASVLALANRLGSDGIDAALDQYETFPNRGWIHWMKDRVRETKFILVICTEVYRRRWDGDEQIGRGLGAIYESGLIQQLLYDASGINDRFVPVLLNESDGEHIPLELRRYTHFRLYEGGGYERLFRFLTNQPTIQKPVVGRALPIREAQLDFRNLFWNVPPRNPFFTGRATYLDAVRTALQRGASVALKQPLSISSMGGVGKTQTAIEYAHLYRADYPAVLWCEADSQELLLSGFSAIANLLDLPERDEQDRNIVLTAVGRWLELNSGWLLILDNVEDLFLIRQVVPASAQGHVLITTRLHATGEFAESLHMDNMDKDEGALLLLRRARIVPRSKSLEESSEADRSVAQQISAEMDGLPLALDQAGAFIEETPSSLSEYFSLYRAEGAALRARRGKLASSHSSVTITFSLAIARVAQANAAAAELVRACAFLAPDAIPEEVFTQAGGQWGEPIGSVGSKPLEWVAAIEEAAKFALIRRTAGFKTLSIHRLVQEVAKDEMSLQTRQMWAERAKCAVAQVFPDVRFENWLECERLLPHARAALGLPENPGSESSVAGRLLNQAAHYLYERAQYTEAAPLAQRLLAIREKTLGPDHPDVASSLNDLALLYQNVGKYTEAEPLYRRSLSIWEKALGPDHPHVAISFSNLAALYDSQGKYAEAEPLYRRSLAIREKALGPDHPDLATILNNLAALYDSQGHYTEAEPLYKRSLAIREKVLGPDHPDVAQSSNNLAELYRIQGKYVEAEPLYRRSLAIWRKAFGPDHPHVARTLNNLAGYCHGLLQYADAERLYQRSLSIWEKALGPDHPDVARTLNNLAELYRTEGKYAEAEPLYRRSLAIREKALGPDHPDLAQSLNNLALLYQNVGKYTEAEPLYRRSLSIWEKALGPDHPHVAISFANLAALYDNQGQYTEAEPLYRRSLEIREKALGPEHPDVASSLNNLAGHYHRQGQYTQAEPLYQRSLAIAEKELGPNHPTAMRVRLNLEVLRTGIPIHPSRTQGE